MLPLIMLACGLAVGDGEAGQGIVNQPPPRFGGPRHVGGDGSGEVDGSLVAEGARVRSDGVAPGPDRGPVDPGGVEGPCTIVASPDGTAEINIWEVTIPALCRVAEGRVLLCWYNSETKKGRPASFADAEADLWVFERVGPAR